MTQERQFTVREVAHLTGIPPATLRKWEERYQVVTPTRLPNGYRLYSARDVALLRQVNAQVQAGSPVSRAVAAAHEGLTAPEMPPPPKPPAGEPGAAAYYQSRLIESLTAVREQESRQTLDEAFAVLQVEQVLSTVLEPVLREIGRLWETGAISEYQEHFASVLIRDRLAALRALLPAGAGPHLITACLPGELHEIGILMVTILALRQGCRVTHLSGSPSPEGLKRAVQELRPAAVLLSATMAEHLSAQLDYLRELAAQALQMPSPPEIIVAGQAVGAFAALPEIPGVRFATQDARTILSSLAP